MKWRIGSPPRGSRGGPARDPAVPHEAPPLEQRAGILIARRFGSGDQLVVIVAMPDRLLEDRRVRGDAAQPVVGDQPAELAALQKVAADKVEPYRLPVFLKRPQRIGHLATFLPPSGFAA